MFKILKKAVSGALAGLMIVSVLPVSVSAEAVYLNEEFNDTTANFKSNYGSAKGGYEYKSDLSAMGFYGEWAEGKTQRGAQFSIDGSAEGLLFAQYRFMLDSDETRVSYLPLSFGYTDMASTLGGQIKTVYVDDGILRAATKPNDVTSPAQATQKTLNSQEICDVKANQWYTVKLLINLNKDSEGFNKYSVYVNDESSNKEYRIKDLYFGSPNESWNNSAYSISEISTYYLGYVYGYPRTDGETAADVDTKYTMYLDYAKLNAAQDGDEKIFDEPVPGPEPTDDKYLQIDFDSSYSGDNFLSSGAASGVHYADNNDGTFTFKYAGGRGKAYIHKTDSTITGSVYSEARFKYTGTNNEIVYEPLTPSQLEEKSLTSAAKTVFITGGKFYAASKYTGKATTASENISDTNWAGSLLELCDAAPNKWYKLQMRTNVTEDTSSFNTYEICITDEESGTRYIKKDLYFGLPSVCWNYTSYNMNGIGEFKYGGVGHTAYAGTTAEESTLTMDYVMARKATSDDDAAFTETTPDPDPSGDKYFINEDFENGDPTTTGDKWSWNWNVKELKTENNNSYLRIMRATTDTSKQYAPSGWYYKTAYGKSGNVVVEGDFRINSTVSNEDKEGVFPIYLKTAEDLNKVIRTVYAKNDALYAVAKMPSSAADKSTGISNEVKLCDIDSTKWYNIKIVLNVDGKADTVDTFMCQVTDKATGNVLNTSGPYALGYKNGRWQAPEFDITQIGNIGFGMTHDFSEASISCDIDNIKVYEAEALTVTSSVENGAANVEPGAVALTFNYAIAADSVSQITLYEKKNGSWTSVSASKTLDSTGKIATITADTMKYGKEYKIVVPTTVSAVTGEALKAEVEITFTTKEMPKVLVVSNVKFNGSTSLAQLTPGASVNVTADFKNTGLNNNQPATLIVAAYNNDGTMVAVAYKRKPIALNATESLDASITLPTAEGKQAAQIKVFAWDDFESMQEMSDVVIMPQ